MTAWRAGAAVMVASGAVPAAARAGAPSEDQLAFRAYQAQLGQLLATEAASQRPGADRGRSAAECKLFQGAPERVPAQECMSCHGLHTTHPVEIDYENSRLKDPGLRSGAEVVRRGVFLPDGKVQCVSCHDATSRWAYHIAIPSGARVRPAVNQRDPSTYERPVALAPPQALPEGTSVSPTPLCTVCHTYGD
jgi:hypothetical protein